MLSRKNQIPDDTIAQKVTQQLSNRGLRSPCKVVVRALNGEVTLSGSVQHTHQKTSAVQVTRGVAGVRRIVDQLQVTPMKKY